MEIYTPNNVEVQETKTKAIKTPFSMAKTLLWMGFGLLVTAVVSFVLPDILNAICQNADQFTAGYITLYIVSIVLILPCTFIVSRKALTNKPVGTAIAFLFYAIGIGMLLSTVFMQCLMIFGSTETLNIIAISFFVSAGCFLLMGGIGMLVKKDLGMLLPFISSLLLGALVLSLVNVFLQVDIIFWVVDLVLFFYVLVMAAINMNAVKRLAESSTFKNSTAMAIYCGFSLYVSFINIFLRVLYFVMILFANRRN